jgi:putative hemolysin
MLSPEEIEKLAAEPVRFSYTDYVAPGLKRKIIDALERLGGRDRLESGYWEHRREIIRDPWRTALSLLGIEVQCSEEERRQIPETGPVIVIANHPYGALDGLVASDLIYARRSDLKIVANRVLVTIPAIRHQLIPIDFDGSREATRANLDARRQAVDHVRNGGALLLFPAGGVSTARGFFGPIRDLPWPSFTAKVIRAAQAPVLPVYFQGANTGLFQVASQFSLTLRLGLLMRELSKRLGTTVDVRIGKEICPDELVAFERSPELLEFLRHRLYSLGDSEVASGTGECLDEDRRIGRPQNPQRDQC